MAKEPVTYFTLKHATSCRRKVKVIERMTMPHHSPDLWALDFRVLSLVSEVFFSCKNTESHILVNSAYFKVEIPRNTSIFNLVLAVLGHDAVIIINR